MADDYTQLSLALVYGTAATAERGRLPPDVHAPHLGPIVYSDPTHASRITKMLKILSSSKDLNGVRNRLISAHISIPGRPDVQSDDQFRKYFTFLSNPVPDKLTDSLVCRKETRDHFRVRDIRSNSDKPINLFRRFASCVTLVA